MLRQGQGRMSTRGGGAAPLSSRQLAALVLLFAVTALCFLLLDRGRLLEPLKGPLDRPILAINRRFAALGGAVRHIGDRFGNTAQLREENARLKAENERLQADAARALELERDNKQLTEQAHLAQQFPQYPLLPARVLGRNPTSAEKYLVIDRGSADGIKVGMPALNPNFLVGLVTEVYPHRAKITLIIDQNSHIGVLLQDQRTPGIMDGAWQQGGRLTVRYLARDVTVAPKARFITAGGTEGGTLGVPQGILVGVAISAKKDTQNDSLQVEVYPLVDFDGLESVTIMLTDQQR